jgi:tRNA pseudouridine55 synthase
MNGLLVIDKPAAISSAGVVARVKRLLQAEKAGHTGTLDPAATGVLVCCINQATRLARFLLHAPKTYAAELTLGVATDTQDAGGEVLARRALGPITAEDLQRALSNYVGDLWQSPPAFSALKQAGVPLYTLARRGQPVSKPPRRVSVYRIQLRSVELPLVRFEVSCSAGTYIRTLCADIGRDLGCGGHMSRLTRLECHGFTLAQALSLDRLEELAREGRTAEVLVPMERALTGLPEITAGPPLIEKIQFGRPVTRQDLPGSAMAGPAETEARFFKIMGARGELAAIVQSQPGQDALAYCCVFATPKRG